MAEFDGRTRRHAIGWPSSDDVIRSRAVPRGCVHAECVSWLHRSLPVYRRATVWPDVRRGEGRRRGSPVTTVADTTDRDQVLSAQQFQQVLITFIVIWQPKAGLKQSHKRRHKQLPINNTHGAAIGSAHNIRLNHSIFSEFYQLYDIKVSFFTRGIVSSQKAFGVKPSHPIPFWTWSTHACWEAASPSEFSISWRCLMPIKLEWLGNRMVKNSWQYVKPFSYNTGTSRTDGQTDRQICYINIARQCAEAR